MGPKPVWGVLPEAAKNWNSLNPQGGLTVQTQEAKDQHQFLEANRKSKVSSSIGAEMSGSRLEMEQGGSWAFPRRTKSGLTFYYHSEATWVLPQHTQNKEWGEDTFISFSFSSPTSFIVNFVWLFYLLNKVNSFHNLWGLAVLESAGHLRLPAHLWLKDTVTLDTSKDASRMVVSLGCLPSGEPLIRLPSVGSRQEGKKERERKAIKSRQQNASVRGYLEK